MRREQAPRGEESQLRSSRALAVTFGLQLGEANTVSARFPLVLPSTR